jgi:hypothetical protein
MTAEEWRAQLESASRAAAFSTGQCLDVMPACPDLAMLADAAAGPDDLSGRF